ncbi:MAG: phytoene dehydrogenase [Deltaproteobacteria bacterium]|nr:MAG: phytoene dehydrogenase [Deltaproteobacteria bacterium]
MTDRYYDVIVVGRSLGALVAAALLARRDFTVLVIGQARRTADYTFEGKTLRRRAFTLWAAGSPVWRRIIGELAQTQTWSRRVEEVTPTLQLLMPGRRLDIPPDAAHFSREVDREFPEARRMVSELYRDLGRVAAAADGAFERDAIWPPGSFMERRETGRVASTLPYARAEPHADLLAEFPRGHWYRRIVTESVRFATDLAAYPPAFAAARLHGAWTRGLVALGGGERELDQILMDRVESNGGVCRMHERVAGIEVRRGGASGVQLDGDAQPVGAGLVITDMLGEELAALAGGQGISKKAQSEWPRVIPGTGRFVVSMLTRRAGVPIPLGKEALVFTAGGIGEVAHTIHLQRVRCPDPDEELLVAELLLSERDPLPKHEARAWVVERLCRELPYLDRHLLLVDSVHDGLPLWRFEPATGPSGAEARSVQGAGRLLQFARQPVEVERTALQGAAARAEPMERQLDVDPPGYLGLAGEPIRGPIARTLLVGRSVLPALGQEGRLLAACGAARLVTRSDKRKARMRREMWTKIEIS